MKPKCIVFRLFARFQALSYITLWTGIQLSTLSSLSSPVFPRDATSCLLMPTVCFSCLLAKPFDTSVDGPAVHKTAERHISARFPQGVTEGSVSADPCSSVSGSRRQWNLLPVKVKLRDNKIKSCITNSCFQSFIQAWIIVVDNWRF